MEGGHSFALPLRGTRDVTMGNTEEATDSEPQGQPLTTQNLALLAGGQDEQKEDEEPEESEDEDEEMADKVSSRHALHAYFIQLLTRLLERLRH